MSKKYINKYITPIKKKKFIYPNYDFLGFLLNDLLTFSFF